MARCHPWPWHRQQPETAPIPAFLKKRPFCWSSNICLRGSSWLSSVGGRGPTEVLLDRGGLRCHLCSCLPCSSSSRKELVCCPRFLWLLPGSPRHHLALVASRLILEKLILEKLRDHPERVLKTTTSRARQEATDLGDISQ